VRWRRSQRRPRGMARLARLHDWDHRSDDVVAALAFGLPGRPGALVWVDGVHLVECIAAPISVRQTPDRSDLAVAPDSKRPVILARGRAPGPAPLNSRRRAAVRKTGGLHGLGLQLPGIRPRLSRQLGWQPFLRWLPGRARWAPSPRLAHAALLVASSASVLMPTHISCPRQRPAPALEQLGAGAGKPPASCSVWWAKPVPRLPFQCHPGKAAPHRALRENAAKSSHAWQGSPVPSDRSRPCICDP